MSTTSDPSLPRSAPEAQEALLSKPASEDKHTVVEHTLKNRKVVGSPAYPDDETWLRGHVAVTTDRSYYPQGAIRQYAAIMASPPRTEPFEEVAHPRTLVLHGAADILIMPKAGRHTAACVSRRRAQDHRRLGPQLSANRHPHVGRSHRLVHRNG